MWLELQSPIRGAISQRRRIIIYARVFAYFAGSIVKNGQKMDAF
jgi:hypothetical protein